jgi:hypothetical protein
MRRRIIFGILEAQQQEHHIDPFNGITCRLQGIEPSGEGNNHSAQTPKLHPMDLLLLDLLIMKTLYHLSYLMPRILYIDA